VAVPTLSPRRARLALLLAAGCTAPAAGGVPPGFHHERLPNGLAVSVLEDPALEVVATQVWYHVGAADEEPESRGLAHLFEHLMFGASERDPAGEYSSYHTRHGGTENAYTTSDETVYVSEIAPEHFGPVLAMEAARMRGLAIDRESLENEKRIVTEELRLRTENDPVARAFLTVQEAVFGEHPYARAPTGRKEDIAGTTVEACRAFYDRHYRPDNAHIVVVGPLPAADVLAEVHALFGAIPGGVTERAVIPALVDWEFPAAPIVVEEDLPPVETAALAFPFPPADARERYAIELLGHLLAGGAVDPFREEIVTRRGRALEAGVERLGFRRGAALVFYAVSLPYRRMDTAFDHAREGIAHLSRLEWLTEESLEAARRALLRHDHAESFYAADRAGGIGRAAWWLGDPREAFEFERGIAAVTREEIVEIWRRHVAQAEPIRVYTKPERVPLGIRLFGWLYPLVRG
jgi:zinc protease